jgi:adenylate cyclase class IV
MTPLLLRLLWLFVNIRAMGASAKPNQFEIERKYRLTLEEFNALQTMLEERGFKRAYKFALTDTFLPARNKGELIRVRDQKGSDGSSSVLTLKSWVQIAGQREREEREVDPLDRLSRSVLLIFGRRAADATLLSYTKEREEFQAERDGLSVTAALDYTDQLGEFSGYYLEFEVIAHDNNHVERARATISKLVAEFLGDAERPQAPSYKDMLERSKR